MLEAQPHSLWQPYDLADSCIALQSCFYLLFAEVWVAVGVEQTLLSRQQGTAGEQQQRTHTQPQHEVPDYSNSHNTGGALVCYIDA